VSDAPSARATDASARIGHPRVHLRRTDSTNERARVLALAGAPHGTLVTADEQTAGRGRQGRTWSAPAGSALLMSLLLRSPPTLLPLIAAVAVCDVVGERAKIKWPNDIVVELEDARLAKLAGILVEARIQEGWAVLGIGVNVAVRLADLPEELRGGASGAMPAASLERMPADVEPTLAALLAALEHRLSEPDAATLEVWRTRDALRGRTIAWAGGRGRADGIDGTGRLVVVLEDGGRTALSAGEVHLLELGERR
jgi:BirA family biotin operon repressor/biotin-[acetyl-CoA-carboxylase] ligase